MTVGFAALIDAATRMPDDHDIDVTSTRILDAAVLETAEVGLRRITVDNVVRRAGVSRMTAYRRYPRRENLIDALVQRETHRFLAAVAHGIDNATDPEDGVAEAFIAAVRFTRAHPILRRVGQTDSALPTQDTSALLDAGATFIADRLTAGSQSVAPQRLRWIADVFARLFLTYITLPPTNPDFTDDAELRRFAHQILTPLVQSI